MARMYGGFLPEALENLHSEIRCHSNVTTL
jgi:hypothetical protein